MPGAHYLGRRSGVVVQYATLLQLKTVAFRAHSMIFDVV